MYILILHVTCDVMHYGMTSQIAVCMMTSANELCYDIYTIYDIDIIVNYRLYYSL